MTRAGVLIRAGAAAALLSVPLAAVAQTTPDLASQRAESLRLSGRPWHAAETLLAAAAREPRLNATFIVEGAKAELRARRYDRARSLLVGQPWLEDYAGGEALAVLAEAEARLGLATAAGRYAAARARTTGVRAALLAVREGLAWEVVGERDSAAAAYAAARAAGLSSIEPWLRVRQARVTRDTATAFRLLANLPAPVAREAGAARAQALLAAGDSAAALEALAQAGRSLDVARFAGRSLPGCRAVGASPGRLKSRARRPVRADGAGARVGRRRGGGGRGARRAGATHPARVRRHRARDEIARRGRRRPPRSRARAAPRRLERRHAGARGRIVGGCGPVPRG